MPTLLDTHAWIWWVTEDRRLSKRARSAIDAALAEQDLWLSLISVWEVATKVEKQQLVLDRPVDQWLDEAMAMQGLGVWEITRPVLIHSCDLPQPDGHSSTTNCPTLISRWRFSITDVLPKEIFRSLMDTFDML